MIEYHVTVFYPSECIIREPVKIGTFVTNFVRNILKSQTAWLYQLYILRIEAVIPRKESLGAMETEMILVLGLSAQVILVRQWKSTHPGTVLGLFSTQKIGEKLAIGPKYGSLDYVKLRKERRKTIMWAEKGCTWSQRPTGNEHMYY